MDWTASVTDKRIDKRGNLVVTVLFSDGARELREEFATSQGQPDGWLEKRVSERLFSLDAISVTPAPAVGTALERIPPEPTDERTIEARAFYADVLLMRQYMEAIRLGIPLEGSKDYSDLRERLAQTFHPDYLELL